MMTKRAFILLLVSVCLLFLGTVAYAGTQTNRNATQWRQLAPGLRYTRLMAEGVFGYGYLHAFQIDLHQYRLRLGFANRRLGGTSQVRDIALLQKALIAINGGFFSRNLRPKPMGLRVDQGRIQHALKRISWWGVFYTRNSHAYIVRPQNYRHRSDINFAVQAGPRLVVDGWVPSLKPGMANRTALGVTHQGKLIIVVTQNLRLSTTQLAKLMRKSPAKGGFGCVNAINLDGGHSSQIYAQIGRFHLSVPGYSRVTDAVLVYPVNSNRRS